MMFWLYKNDPKVVPDVDWVNELYTTLFNADEPNTVSLFTVIKSCALFVDVIVQAAEVTPVPNAL